MKVTLEMVWAPNEPRHSWSAELTAKDYGPIDWRIFDTPTLTVEVGEGTCSRSHFAVTNYSAHDPKAHGWRLDPILSVATAMDKLRQSGVDAIDVIDREIGELLRWTGLPTSATIRLSDERTFSGNLTECLAMFRCSVAHPMGPVMDRGYTNLMKELYYNH